jgi:kinetochore protein NDC80
MLNDIVKFKMHVQKNLEEYEGFVADELEQELLPEEGRDDSPE